MSKRKCERRAGKNAGPMCLQRTKQNRADVTVRPSLAGQGFKSSVRHQVVTARRRVKIVPEEIRVRIHREIVLSRRVDIVQRHRSGVRNNLIEQRIDIHGIDRNPTPPVEVVQHSDAGSKPRVVKCCRGVRRLRNRGRPVQTRCQAQGGRFKTRICVAPAAIRR
jgi:hypothetical protein